MLSAKLFGENDIRMVECEVPRIGENEILVKTCAAAICGSDLRMIQNGYMGVDEDHPLTLGHEISGVIVGVGKAVRNYRPGMRVFIAPNFGCGECKSCREGDYHLCGEYEAFGINTDGGFAEYIRVPDKAVRQGCVIPLKDSISMEEAAVFEPAACVLNGQERAGIKKGDSILIFGAGPIGVLHALLAKAQGAGMVFLSDLSGERLEKGKAVAPFVITGGPEKIKDTVMSMTGGRGVDVCITACASKEVQENSFDFMDIKGRILFFGGLPQGKDCIQLHSNILHYRELKVCGSTRCNAGQCRKIAHMAEDGSLDLRGLITREFELGRFLEAVEYAESGQGLKTLIRF